MHQKVAMVYVCTAMKQCINYCKHKFYNVEMHLPVHAYTNTSSKVVQTLLVTQLNE